MVLSSCSWDSAEERVGVTQQEGKPQGQLLVWLSGDLDDLEKTRLMPGGHLTFREHPAF